MRAKPHMFSRSKDIGLTLVRYELEEGSVWSPDARVSTRVRV